MRMGESIVYLTTAILVGWIGYRVIGIIVPAILVASFIVGTVANKITRK
jgi:hypothetical protein